MKIEYKRLLNHVIYISVFSFYVIFLQITEIYSPVTYLFGIPTPTTGTTRALISFLKGNLSDAFHKHPLFPLSPFFGISLYLLFFYKNKKFLYSSIVFAIIYFIVFIIRLYAGIIYY